MSGKDEKKLFESGGAPIDYVARMRELEEKLAQADARASRAEQDRVEARAALAQVASNGHLIGKTWGEILTHVQGHSVVIVALVDGKEAGRFTGVTKKNPTGDAQITLENVKGEGGKTVKGAAKGVNFWRGGKVIVGDTKFQFNCGLYAIDPNKAIPEVEAE